MVKYHFHKCKFKNYKSMFFVFLKDMNIILLQYHRPLIKKLFNINIFYTYLKMIYFKYIFIF